MFEVNLYLSQEEEFFLMLKSELDKMESEHKSLEQIRNITSYHKERDVAVEFKLRKINHNIMFLKSILSLPAYLRIQLMSDIELDDYKKTIINKAELIINELQEKEELKKASIPKLDIERDQYILGLKKNKDLVRKYQSDIDTLTSQQIRQLLSRDIQEEKDLIEIINRTSKPIDLYTNLLAEIALDDDKTFKYIDLVKKEKYLRQNDERAVFIYRTSHIPLPLEQKIISRFGHIWWTYKYSFEQLNELLTYVEEFREACYSDKNNFNKQYSNKKLSLLEGYYQNLNISKIGTIDSEFFQQFAEIIDVHLLEELKSIVGQRDGLSRTFFKSKDIKGKICELNYRILNIKYSIYSACLYDISKDFSNISNYFGIHTEPINLIDEAVKKAEVALNDFKIVVERAKEESARIRENTRLSREEIEQEIRALGGEKFKEVPISFDNLPNDNLLKPLYDAFAVVYQKNIVDRVRQAAENHADIREAELNSRATEQLLQDNNQESEIYVDFIGEIPKDKTSHSIR